MQINLEIPEKNTIQAYSDAIITVNNADYCTSLIIGREAIISPWAVNSVHKITEETLRPILELKPEVILIGHNETVAQLPIPVVQFLANQRIGIECMSVGAASRTFNVLLGEQRAVVIGIVF